MKVAIMTDSNSGITQSEAKELGIFVLPMPFTIDGQEYKEDINLTQEEFYDKLMNGAEVFTSQPAAGEVTAFFDRILEDYDQIVHIPMSSGLSGSCQTAMMLADDEDYKGKVFVVDSQRISVTQKWDVLDAMVLAKQGKDAKEIHDILMENKFNASIYITVNTLEYLKKGGRITPAAAALGGLLKIKPVLTIQGEKLDSFQKTRTMQKASKIMIEALQKDIKERIDPIHEDMSEAHIMIAYTYDRDLALEFKKEVEEAFAFPMFPDGRNLALAREMQKCQSVAIHVRKGKDYASRHWYTGTCPVDYYLSAVELMKTRLDAPRFYVFTDNPDWVRENFTGFAYTLVTGNPVAGPGSHYDMQLMSLCRHNIISNSTYSWWGAYLNRHDDKIIVAPDVWFNPESCKEYRSEKIICRNWFVL